MRKKINPGPFSVRAKFNSAGLTTKLPLLSVATAALMLMVSCSPHVVPAGSNGQNLDIKQLADGLRDTLKNKVVGFAFTIHYNGELKSNRDGGKAIKSPDSPERAMTILESYSCASVSKTVTATALLIALNNNPNVGLNSTFASLLPSHWTKGSNIDKITFRQLLTHNSGFRYGLNGIDDGDSYQTLKALVARGISLADTSVREYNNRNYALLRILIPMVTGFNYVLPNNYTALQERQQDTLYATSYRDYCKRNVFDKLLFYTADVKPTPSQNAKYYAFGSNAAGIGNGDHTMIAGGQGWIMNTGQMGKFFAHLRHFEDILPRSLMDRMVNELMGYDRDGTADGVRYFWKNGIYNIGDHGYRSLIIGFANGIQISIMANSKVNLQNAAIDAFEAWYH
jgi:CubicO group peptidase (beta-lactamase class C family)